jgi:hypothetical protein
MLVLSLFFSSFFVHIRSPLKCEENEREQKKGRDRKKSSKQGGERDKKKVT